MDEFEKHIWAIFRELCVLVGAAMLLAIATTMGYVLGGVERAGEEWYVIHICGVVHFYVRWIRSDPDKPPDVRDPRRRW